jgi:hypothetical protein
MQARILHLILTPKTDVRPDPRHARGGTCLRMGDRSNSDVHTLSQRKRAFQEDRMKKRHASGVAVAAVGLMTAACASGPAVDSPSLDPSRTGSAIVVEGSQLRQQNTDILTVLSRVSAVQIRRTSNCPVITMRGQKTYFGSPDPLIYVNGTPAGNTCLLEMMRSEDVQRIEVYPTGVSSRPEYSQSPNGLILIFLRSAVSDMDSSAG